jgi:uncharacterized protein YbaP (TraB family)
VKSPLLALLLTFALAACSPQPQPARPAFWQVTGPNGEKAWLLGTIHALPQPAAWRSPAIDKAFAEADSVAVEVSGLGDAAAMSRAYALLSTSAGLPPLAQRIDPAMRAALAERLKRAGQSEADYANTETWGAALMLARADATPEDSANGIDRAVLRLARGKRVIEFEGAEAQFGIFDALPEKEQRDLLEAVLREGASPAGESADLIQAWRSGDFATIEAETRRGLLADPELRDALFTARNRAWADRIALEMAGGRKLFVAVGAAHMAGHDGLAAMLAARRCRVQRVQ